MGSSNIRELLLDSTQNKIGSFYFLENLLSLFYTLCFLHLSFKNLLLLNGMCSCKKNDSMVICQCKMLWKSQIDCDYPIVLSLRYELRRDVIQKHVNSVWACTAVSPKPYVVSVCWTHLDWNAGTQTRCKTTASSRRSTVKVFTHTRWNGTMKPDHVWPRRQQSPRAALLHTCDDTNSMAMSQDGEHRRPNL